MRFTQFALALSTLALVCELHGQAAPDSAVATLKPGDTLRIRVFGGERIEASLVSLQTEPLGLRLLDRGAALDVAAIDSLWVRGKATRAGAKAGAVVLGALSVVGWGLLCTALNEGTCDQWGIVAVYSLVGAGVGALIGAGIGSLIPNWQLRYARAAPVQGTLIPQSRGRLGFGVAYTVGL